MARVPDDRALWIARNILPYESALRRHLQRWRFSHDLDVDDVIQEAYSRFAAMASVDHIQTPRTYLFSVVRGIVLMHMRRARVVSIRAMDEYDTLALPADEPSPEDHVSDRQQLLLLADAIASLPEPGRRALLMRVMEELPYREIGARLGLTDNAVQKSVAKSLVRLMALLGRDGNSYAGASRDNKSKVRGRGDEARDKHGN